MSGITKEPVVFSSDAETDEYKDKDFDIDKFAGSPYVLC